MLREPISKDHFKAFEKEIWKTRLQLSPADNQKYIIDFVLFKNGYGIVACTDSASSQWVKALAADFCYGSEKTRAWACWERAEAVVFQGFLHGNSFKDPDMKAKFVIGSILKFNGLQGEFDVITWDTKVPNGVFLSFEPKGPLIAKLEGRKRLNAGICTLVLTKRLRKKRTKEDFLKFQEDKAAAERKRKEKHQQLAMKKKSIFS